MWNFRWSREITNRNASSFNNILEILNRFEPRTGATDQWRWKHEENGVYAMNKAYKLLRSRHAMNLEEEMNKAVYKCIRKSWAIAKVIPTAWKLLKGRIATKENLVRRGVTFNNEERMYPLCKEDEETTAHLFFNCKFANSIWLNFFSWLGVSMAMHSNPSIHFLQF